MEPLNYKYQTKVNLTQLKVDTILQILHILFNEDDYLSFSHTRLFPNTIKFEICTNRDYFNILINSLFIYETDIQSIILKIIFKNFI